METAVYIFVCFWSYFIISLVCWRLKITKIEDAVTNRDQDGFMILNIRHFLGIMIFGAAGFVFFQQSDFIFLNDSLFNPALSFAVALFATISMDLSISDALSKNILFNFQLTIKEGLVYIIIRLLFLLVYEIFFRGVLFWFSLQYLDLINAILINLFFYALIHILDSKKEILGSIPFGIVLCLFTYFSGSIWPAFIIHASLSLGYEAIIISKGLTKIQKS